MNTITLTKEEFLNIMTKVWFDGNKSPRDQYKGEIAHLNARGQMDNAFDQMVKKQLVSQD